MNCSKKCWSEIICRLTKVDSVTFFVKKTLATLEDPEEIAFLRALEIERIHDIGEEQVSEDYSSR